MPLILITLAHGGQYEAEGQAGDTLLRAAQMAGIDGFLAECGGNGTCGTCHCYIEADGLHKLTPAEDAENQMLDYVADERRPNSRLACRIQLTRDLDSLQISVPARQI
ncbi:MAG: hypothetical protein RJA34_2772 [Pseudomonadota bacterium]